MRFEISYREILESGDWVRFCAAKGYDEYFINDGRGDSSETEMFTTQEVRDFGLADLVRRELIEGEGNG